MKKIIVTIFLFLFIIMTISLRVDAQNSDLQLMSRLDLENSLGKKEVSKLLDLLPQDLNLDEPELILINKENPVSTEIDFEGVYSDQGLLYNALASPSFNEWMQAAVNDGFYFSIVSAYRSMESQANNRLARYHSYLSEGLDPDTAQMYVDMFYAPADASEHLSGLALDLLGSDWTSQGGELMASYGQMPSAQWLAQTAPEFGFILRYPEGKEEITGYNYEPWHFRYVGNKHASFISRHNLTLEEYLSLIVLKHKD